MAASHHVPFGASRWGKGKTASQVVAISLLIVTGRLGEFRWLGIMSLWVVMALALLSAADYFYRFLGTILSSRPGAGQGADHE